MPEGTPRETVVTILLKSASGPDPTKTMLLEETGVAVGVAAGPGVAVAIAVWVAVTVGVGAGGGDPTDEDPKMRLSIAKSAVEPCALERLKDTDVMLEPVWSTTPR